MGKVKKIPFRSIFIAHPGNELLAFDLSQAETWIVAAKAHEQNMFRALNGGDIHSDTAVALFHPEMTYCEHKWQKNDDDSVQCLSHCGTLISKDGRYLGKRYNHASSYRMSYLKAAEIINKDSIITGVAISNAQSKLYSERWHGYYSIKGWWSEIELQLGEAGRTLETVYGFRRTFYGPWGDELFKEATAFEPQSTVSDHCNGAVHPDLKIEGGIIGIRRYLKANPRVPAKIVHTAHDSVTLDVHKSAVDDMIQVCYKNLHRPLIVNGYEFTIPVDGERGERWGELSKIKNLKAA